MAVTSENLRLALVREATLGVTPATPGFVETQITSETLAPDVTFTQSDMMAGGTRGVPSTVMTEASAGGDINRELVYETSTDLLWESLFGNVFGNDPHGNGIGGTELYDYIQIISHTVEKTWNMPPDGSTKNYHLFKGMVAASGTIEFAPGQIITNNISLVGLEFLTADDVIAGATYAPPAGNSPMTTPRVTSMNICDVDTRTPVAWMTEACFTQLTLAIDNTSRALACIGSLQAKEIAHGRINANASGSLYYAGDEPLDALMAETEFAVQVVAEDVEGNEYEFWFPRAKFTETTVLAQGQSQDVLTTFSMQLLESNVSSYSLYIKRTPTP